MKDSYHHKMNDITDYDWKIYENIFYWSLMDVTGYILPIPSSLQDILVEQDWQD